MSTLKIAKEKKEIIHDNPMIDVSVVTEHERLDAELRQLGVDTRPKFNITPPLGDERLHLSMMK